MDFKVSRADLDKIVTNLAQAGKDAPEWVTDSPRLQNIYTKAGGPTKFDTDTPAPKPATTPPGGGDAASPRADTKPKPAAKKARRRRRSPVMRIIGGTASAGGILLAIFTYPIALAIFQHGPAGFGMWMKAKFLNITTPPPAFQPSSETNPTPDTTATAPTVGTAEWRSHVATGTVAS